MIKLLNLIKETILEANIVKVPDEILSKLGGVYDYIKDNLENLKDKASKSSDNPFTPSNFNKFFKLKDLSGKDLEVSIGFYNDEKDFGAGRMDTVKDIMLVNLAHFGNKEFFLELGEHELVHAMDPKVRDQKLFGREFLKKGVDVYKGSKFNLSKSNPNQNSEYQNSVDKFAKAPWEFDAYTAPLLNKLKRNKEKLNNDPKFRKQLSNLFSQIKEKPVKEILQDQDLLDLAWYFSDKEWKSENWQEILSDYKNELNKIKAWSTRPTLYKKFLQRYATVVK
jgi:hypothetical protein